MIEHAGTCSIDTILGHELRFTSGQGGYVYSEKGNKYYDFILGFGPVVVGHSDPEFNSIVSSYLSVGIHFPSYSIYHEEFIKLLEGTQWSAASFFKTSSESVTAAIRIAMCASGRKEVVRCGFIGWHDAEIALTGSWHEPPDSPYRTTLRFTKNFRGVSGEEKVHNWYDFELDTLENILKTEKIAVFIIDAYQLYFCKNNIIREALQLCRDYGTLTVLDETKTSGRVAFLGMSEIENYKPDLLVLGKAIANGAPLSVLCGKQQLSEFSRTARITGTFSKEALSLYCALATRRIFDERNGYQMLRHIGKMLVNTLNDVADVSGVSGLLSFRTVFGGSIINLEFAPEVHLNMTARNNLRLQFAEEGVLILQGHPSFVCLAHKEIDMVELEEKAEKVFRKWKNNFRS